MSETRSTSTGWVVVGLALAIVGLASTWHALRVTPTKVRHIQSKQERLAALEELRAEQGQTEQGIAAFATSDQRLLSALPVVFENALPGATPKFATFDPKPTAQGTTLQTVNVNVGPIDLAKLNGLIEKLEGYDPPWRIVECQIQAAPTQRGWGTVTMSLEGLEKL